MDQDFSSKDKTFDTLACLYLTSSRITFNFFDWSIDGAIPSQYNFSVPLFGDAVSSDELVPMMLQTAEKEFSWNLISGEVLLKPNVKDGVGVNNFYNIVNKDKKDQLTDSMYPSITWDEELMWKFLHGYMVARNIDDLLYVEANISNVIIYRLKKGKEEIYKYKTSNLVENVEVSNVKVDWEEIENKAKQEMWGRMKRFLATTQPEEFIKDIWANLTFIPRIHYESVLAQDILRADLTGSLNSIKSSAYKALGDFGVSSGTKSVLLVTGDYAMFMEDSGLLLSLIDGLELFGTIQIILDKKDVIPCVAKYNIENDDSYTTAIDKAIGNQNLLISVEPQGLGLEDEIVVEGTITDDDGKRDIYGQRNRISRMKISGKGSLRILPLNATNIGGLGNYKVHERVFGKVILDTRDRDDLLYGPEPRNNMSKVHSWLVGLRNT